MGTAASASQSIACAHELQPDVIVLDHVMHDIAGGSTELWPVLSENAPDAAVVLLSGMPPDRLRSLASDIDAHAYVSKAADVTAIREAILSADDERRRRTEATDTT